MQHYLLFSSSFFSYLFFFHRLFTVLALSLIEVFKQIQPSLSLQAFSFIRTMDSKALMGVWVALDILLLAACVLTLVLTVVWRAPNILINMVLSSAALNGKISIIPWPTSES